MSKRSRDLMERLIVRGELESAASMEQKASLPEIVESLGERSFRLVKAEAGWIAC